MRNLASEFRHFRAAIGWVDRIHRPAKASAPTSFRAVQLGIEGPGRDDLPGARQVLLTLGGNQDLLSHLYRTAAFATPTECRTSDALARRLGNQASLGE